MSDELKSSVIALQKAVDSFVEAFSTTSDGFSAMFKKTTASMEELDSLLNNIDRRHKSMSTEQRLEDAENIKKSAHHLKSTYKESDEYQNASRGEKAAITKKVNKMAAEADNNVNTQKAVSEARDKQLMKTDPSQAIYNSIKKAAKESSEMAAIKTQEFESYQNSLLAKQANGEEITESEQQKLIELQTEAANAQKEAFEDGLLENAVNKMVEGVTSSIDRAIDLLNQYEASSEARLQGSDKSYRDIMGKTTRMLSLSPFVKSEKMLENVNKLLEEGVTYNIELRAFLQTVSDKVVATFDATDGTLRRLIRLQQADTTAARMGMQAGLTKFLNSMYQDSSYMKETYSQIAAAIMDTNSQLGRDQAISFESTVQAWIGAMHSVGLSDKGASTIAEGLNYLGSGNVSALAGNESLQTLMAISAEKAGLSYADILTDGLDSGKTNQLLTAMVNYLAEIAEGDNMVVKSEYSRILGLDIADLKAISSIKSDVGALAGQTKSYGSAMGELYSQFAQLPSRVTITEMMTNIMDNFTFNMGRSIASNPVTFGMYKALNLINEGTDGNGIAIPAVSVMGNSFDFNQTIDGLLKSGLVGFSVLSGAMGALSSLSGGFGLNLSAWGGSDYVSRGGGGGAAGAMSTSNTTYVGNQNSSDSRDAALMGGKEEGEEMNKVTNPDQDKELTLTDWYDKVGPDGGDYISVRLDKTFDDLLTQHLPIQSMVLKNIYELMTTGDGVKVKESDNGNPLQNLADTLSNQQKDSATQTTAIVQQLLFALNGNSAGIPINIRTIGSGNIPLGQKSGWPVVPVAEV